MNMITKSWTFSRTKCWVLCVHVCVRVCVICCKMHFRISVHLCLCLSSACTHLVLIFAFFAHLLLLTVCVYVQLKVRIVYVCPLGLCAACCGVMTIYFLPPCTPTYTHTHTHTHTHLSLFSPLTSSTVTFKCSRLQVTYSGNVVL